MSIWVFHHVILALNSFPVIYCTHRLTLTTHAYYGLVHTCMMEGHSSCRRTRVQSMVFLIKAIWGTKAGLPWGSACVLGEMLKDGAVSTGLDGPRLWLGIRQFPMGICMFCHLMIGSWFNECTSIWDESSVMARLYMQVTISFCRKFMCDPALGV